MWVRQGHGAAIIQYELDARYSGALAALQTRWERRVRQHDVVLDDGAEVRSRREVTDELHKRAAEVAARRAAGHDDDVYSSYVVEHKEDE